jgi:hypothetical protein
VKAMLRCINKGFNSNHNKNKLLELISFDYCVPMVKSGDKQYFIELPYYKKNRRCPKEEK